MDHLIKLLHQYNDYTTEFLWTHRLQCSTFLDSLSGGLYTLQVVLVIRWSYSNKTIDRNSKQVTTVL